VRSGNEKELERERERDERERDERERDEREKTKHPVRIITEKREKDKNWRERES
jgi:hypothetical protein